MTRAVSMEGKFDMNMQTQFHSLTQVDSDLAVGQLAQRARAKVRVVTLGELCQDSNDTQQTLVNLTETTHKQHKVAHLVGTPTSEE